MKKIIVLAALSIITYTHHSLCMEDDKIRMAAYRESFNWTIFGYLNFHNASYPLAINPCEGVEKLIKSGIDVNQKEISMVSRLHGMTPLEVAITESKCKRCENSLRSNGAKDTKCIIRWKKHHSNEETT